MDHQFRRVFIQEDELDFVLKAPYDHAIITFPEKIDIYFQNETMLDYTKMCKRGEKKKEHAAIVARREMIDKRYNPHHPLVTSGVKEKVHPSYIKLMNSGHHSPQTNAGYSRQDRDGLMFNY